MDNKPTPKWSIDKDNNLVPYKKKKMNTMTQEAKTQVGKHMIRKITNSDVVGERDITNSSSYNTNNILQTHNSCSSLQGDDETSTNSSSSDDESAPLYAINLERCATLFSESFSESDNDTRSNNHSTVTEINIDEIEDVLDKNHVYTQYTDDSDSESDKPWIGKKKSALKIRMLEPGNGDVVPNKTKQNLPKISQNIGNTLTQLVSTDVWIGREKQTITKPKERVASSNLVTKKNAMK